MTKANLIKEYIDGRNRGSVHSAGGVAESYILILRLESVILGLA